MRINHQTNKSLREELEKEFMDVYELSDRKDIPHFSITGNVAIDFAEYIVTRGEYWDDEDCMGC